ncbi:MFS transporter (plasmid) [Paenibacillus urinalis]|uniref:MFS transporter n=1 Tax=Paenibacillus urinalis TaxID=521520 RepID=A0AAX3N6C8_9BACL|nr:MULTISPECIES: MFS transporter [Paenibacillus]MCM3131041.1 MFS transporter [Paenibacillus sp. MER 78]WDH85371.1 MFS transporter [Paenibacillus urinalis]WDH95191.1 MFS transporter [Paenibacillus urinalis]WDI05335.1 MFS transporter [Paenibacillus urinalis]
MLVERKRNQPLNTPQVENNLRIIAIITAICLFGDAMLYAVLPVYSKDFGLTALWQVGVLLSINRFIRIPIHPLIGWFYTRYSIKSGLMIAIILTIITTFSYGYFQGFAFLLVLRCIWGIAWSFIRQAGQLSIVEAVTVSSQPGKLTGLFNGLSGCGAVVGMVFGSLLSENFGVSFVLMGFGIFALISIPLLFFIRKPGSNEMTKKELTQLDQRAMLKIDSKLLIILFAGFSVSLLFQGYMKSTLSYWIELQDFSKIALLSSIGAATITGILLACKWFSDPILGYWAGKLSDKSKSRTVWLTVSFIAGGIMFAILGLNVNTLAWLLTLIALLLISSIVTTLTDADAAQYASTSSNRHHVVSFYSMIVDVGAALGPFLGFTLLSVFGDTMINTAAALLLWLCSLFLFYNHRRKRLYQVS